jgi:hypothetical protein
MSQPTQEEVSKKDHAPKVGEVEIDPSKMGGIPNRFRGHLFGDRIGERVVAE